MPLAKAKVGCYQSPKRDQGGSGGRGSAHGNQAGVKQVKALLIPSTRTVVWARNQELGDLPVCQ